MFFSHFQLSATIPSTPGTAGRSSVLDLGISVPLEMQESPGRAIPTSFRVWELPGHAIPGFPSHTTVRKRTRLPQKRRGVSIGTGTAAIASTQGSRALPEKENIPPNQKTWTETAEQMGVKRIPKRRQPDETGLTDRSIGVANGKRHRTYKDPYAGVSDQVSTPSLMRCLGSTPPFPPGPSCARMSRAPPSRTRAPPFPPS